MVGYMPPLVMGSGLKRAEHQALEGDTDEAESHGEPPADAAS